MSLLMVSKINVINLIHKERTNHNIGPDIQITEEIQIT